ncbi:hypothetical protein B0H11DRAFT_1902508 [Mycena galericulata]|nr:hypothetical protein B0H11DRAFT_1902508 [Mycena galericulata]
MKEFAADERREQGKARGGGRWCGGGFREEDGLGARDNGYPDPGTSAVESIGAKLKRFKVRAPEIFPERVRMPNRKSPKIAYLNTIESYFGEFNKGIAISTFHHPYHLLMTNSKCASTCLGMLWCSGSAFGKKPPEPEPNRTLPALCFPSKSWHSKRPRRTSFLSLEISACNGSCIAQKTQNVRACGGRRRCPTIPSIPPRATAHIGPGAVRTLSIAAHNLPSRRPASTSTSTASSLSARVPDPRIHTAVLSARDTIGEKVSPPRAGSSGSAARWEATPARKCMGGGGIENSAEANAQRGEPVPGENSNRPAEGGARSERGRRLHAGRGAEWDPGDDDATRPGFDGAHFALEAAQAGKARSVSGSRARWGKRPAQRELREVVDAPVFNSGPGKWEMYDVDVDTGVDISALWHRGLVRTAGVACPGVPADGRICCEAALHACGCPVGTSECSVDGAGAGLRMKSSSVIGVCPRPCCRAKSGLIDPAQGGVYTSSGLMDPARRYLGLIELARTNSGLPSLSTPTKYIYSKASAPEDTAGGGQTHLDGLIIHGIHLVEAEPESQQEEDGSVAPGLRVRLVRDRGVSRRVGRAGGGSVGGDGNAEAAGRESVHEGSVKAGKEDRRRTRRRREGQAQLVDEEDEGAASSRWMGRGRRPGREREMYGRAGRQYQKENVDLHWGKPADADIVDDDYGDDSGRGKRGEGGEGHDKRDRDEEGRAARWRGEDGGGGVGAHAAYVIATRVTKDRDEGGSGGRREEERGDGQGGGYDIERHVGGRREEKLHGVHEALLARGVLFAEGLGNRGGVYDLRKVENGREREERGWKIRGKEVEGRWDAGEIKTMKAPKRMEKRREREERAWEIGGKEERGECDAGELAGEAESDNGRMGREKTRKAPKTDGKDGGDEERG